MKLAIGAGTSARHPLPNIDLIQRAEALGYDSVWTGETWGTDALTPLAYISFSVDSGAHQHTMTWLMRVGGGLAAVPIGLVILFNLFSSRRDRTAYAPARSALLSSMLLFAAGGCIGFMISGSDVTVPAHYHGSIVAVTLAYMGVTYHLLPRLGFREPRGRLVRWQPWIYSGGQLLHVAGLAWSGGYGVQRKTAGAEQGLENFEQIAGMSLMGFGGLISIIGGIMFLLIVYLAIRPDKN